MNNESLKILLVEDSNTDAVLLKEHILLTEKNIDLNQTGSLQEAFDFIRKNHVDAILLDLSLPDSHGLQTIEKTIKSFPRLPIVVLTGIEDETVGVQAVRLGASDYLVKGRVDGEVIIRALNYSIERKANEKALQDANIEQKLQNEKLLQSQTQLEESRRNYSDLFDFAPIGYFVLDNDGIIIDVNSTAASMLGVDKIEMIGKSLAAYIAEEDKKIFYSQDTHIFISNACRQCQIKMHKNGTEFYVELKIDPVLNADNKVIQSRVAVIDITERKRSEQIVRKSAERFQILSETAGKLLQNKNPQVIVNELCQKVMRFLDCQVFFNFLVDEEKKCLHLNACNGIPAEKIKELEWLDYGAAVCGTVAQQGRRIIAENIPERKDPLTNLIASMGIKAYGCHPLMAQNHVIGTLSFGTTERTSFTDDEIRMMKSVCDQVATALERMRFENALYQSEQVNRDQANRLQTILEAAPAVIWIAHDRECKLITGNKGAYEVSRIDLGNNISVENHFSDKFKHYRFLKNGVETKSESFPIKVAASTGKSFMKDEVEILYDDNTSRYLFGNLVPLFDEKNEPNGAIAVYIDVTELKETEKELNLSQQQLRNANTMLESRVKERTSQLEKLIDVLRKEIVERVHAEKQLTENQEKLRSLSSEIIFAEERERRQVATQLHDSIGQLLAFSKKELGVLLNNAPDSLQPSLKEVWEMIKQAVQQTRTLTFDLSPAALYTLGLQAAIEELGEDFSKKGKFKFNLIPTNQEIQMPEQDKVLLYRSVRELLINTIKHSKAKCVEIEIKRPHNSIQITVKDDGIGFNTKEISNKGKAGFGLYSIRERLEAIGGNLKIKSAKGKGTIVKLTAPLKNIENHISSERD
jgi:PAS domain S-box-containing protein